MSEPSISDLGTPSGPMVYALWSLKFMHKYVNNYTNIKLYFVKHCWTDTQTHTHTHRYCVPVLGPCPTCSVEVNDLILVIFIPHTRLQFNTRSMSCRLCRLEVQCALRASKHNEHALVSQRLELDPSFARFFPMECVTSSCMMLQVHWHPVFITWSLAHGR